MTPEAGKQRDKLRTKVHGERTVYDNEWVRLTLVDVEPPDGRRFEHHVVRLHTVAFAAVLDDADRVLMLWRHRFATDEWGWELPGGIVDPGEVCGSGSTAGNRGGDGLARWPARTLDHVPADVGDGRHSARALRRPRSCSRWRTVGRRRGGRHRLGSYVLGAGAGAFFATLYYAGVRPAEAVGLREDDCELPEHGWGLLTLAETRPTSGRKYTDTGDVHDRRGLKQRERKDVRPVPIPPQLVRILREHIEVFDTADDGRLFRNERGGVLGSTTYTRAWQEARRLALTPRQVNSPLAGTPYDLRHAALSTWLNGGVDATDVAERAGNSVEVLLKRYAKCLDGNRERNNKLIEQALLVADVCDVRTHR